MTETPPPPTQPDPNRETVRLRLGFSLRELLMLIMVVALASAFVTTLWRLQRAQAELAVLRQETGYLEPSDEGEIAAVRLPSDLPMTYRVRVRVPDWPPYRVAYSTDWRQSKTSPSWFAAVPLSPGESIVQVQVLRDPQDERWKITTLRRSPEGTRRMATVLPADQVPIFSSPREWLRSGVSNQTTTVAAGKTLRLLDERVLVGEGAMMLYGDRPPSDDMVGIFADLQPDVGPL
ncbi:hypothetical protein NHH03_25210 [Stieleria sp. TO1_6]|uniref:hypothetical protein n=1 Tax=Stieleria tagensis TaxID=2956795 RepID=UPI00209BA9BD|nr:hypothetical protein [Stieleria tagensis]MCO8125060.1 hypothetical protein [Stieleria tagensis]